MRAYCTLFNSYYLVRGLALFQSLSRHAGAFRLYVFAMDEVCAGILESMNDSRLIVVRAAEFEDEALLAVKGSRTVAEYFWTCTPSILLHCLLSRGETECTYVDADVWLLANPEPIFEGMGPDSVLLTEHKYAARYDQSSLSGRYCVQFMPFRATPDGLAALNWWRDRCLEWCFARREGNRFGDQKYLDDWTDRFAGVHVCRLLGAGTAPWNSEKYRFRRGTVAPGPELSEDGSNWQPVYFHHFHGMRSFNAQTVCFAFGYRLGRDVKDLIYFPYAEELSRIFWRLEGQLSGLAAQGVAPAASNDGNWLRSVARRIYSARNTHKF